MIQQVQFWARMAMPYVKEIISVLFVIYYALQQVAAMDQEAPFQRMYNPKGAFHG